MSNYVYRKWTMLFAVLVASLSGCTTTAPINEALKIQTDALSPSSYEQIRPSIGKIQVGDLRSKVLEIVKPRVEQGRYFQVSEGGRRQILKFFNWPGVLTPFDTSGYLHSPDKLDAMHFGYIEGRMLRPRRILIFEKDTVSNVIDVADPIDLVKDPGVTVLQTGPLGHLTKKAYEDMFLRNKEHIKSGMHLWEVFSMLGANYIATQDLQSYAIICPGFLNYKRGVVATKTPEGVRAFYPFGYIDEDSEVVQWEIEMLNYRVVSVRPYRR